MRSLFIISTIIIFLFCACTSPSLGQNPDTPLQISADSECGFVWASEQLADLSNKFDEKLKDIQPQANGYAEAYGENCIDSQGNNVRFLAMETDFYVSLEVNELEDQQVLGELTGQVLDVIAEFPTDETPGPQSGYVGITFVTHGNELRMRFSQTDAKAAIENGLQGEELFNALQAK